MEIITGILLTIFSGVLNGSFVAPTKKIKGWEWENTWLVYAFLGMVIFPLAVTIIYIPQVAGIYSNVPFNNLVTTFLFGMGWGTGSVLFGLAIRLVGFSVGYTIVIGGIAAFGTLIPFIVNNEASVFSEEGMPVLLAVLSTVIGVFFCAWAGKVRDRDITSENTAAQVKKKFMIGLLIAISAGLLSSMLNFAFSFGKPIAETAKQNLADSATPFLINHTVWTVALAGGFIPFLVYCIYLMQKNKSFKNYNTNIRKTNWLYASLMALIWFSCIVLYGIGSEKLGKLGTSFGWLILMSVTVIVGNIWGFITNEWKGTSLKARRLMLTGILFLIANILIIGISGR